MLYAGDATAGRVEHGEVAPVVAKVVAQAVFFGEGGGGCERRCGGIRGRAVGGQWARELGWGNLRFVFEPVRSAGAGTRQLSVHARACVLKM